MKKFVVAFGILVFLVMAIGVWYLLWSDIPSDRDMMRSSQTLGWEPSFGSLSLVKVRHEGWRDAQSWYLFETTPSSAEAFYRQVVADTRRIAADRSEHDVPWIYADESDVVPGTLDPPRWWPERKNDNMKVFALGLKTPHNSFLMRRFYIIDPASGKIYLYRWSM